MNSDDSLENLIEYDPASSSDKENEETRSRVRPPKTTPEQFQEIATFVTEHDESRIGKKAYDLMWDNLADKLNGIGPPEHTTSQWKRIWSVRKYNLKRKRSVQSDCQDPQHSENLDPPPCPNCSASVDIGQTLQALVSNQQLLFDQMGTVITQQSEMISNQKSVIRELHSSNAPLQEIIAKKP